MATQFRRIHGRVIPIRDKNEREPAKGSALVAGGIGVSALSGRVAASLSRDAAHYTNASRAQRLKAHASRAMGAQHDLFSSMNNRAAGQHFFLSKQNRIEAIRFGAAAKNIRRGGVAAGAALVAAGTDKLLPKKVKENTKARVATDVTAGAGASIAARAVYHKYLGGKSLPWSKAFKIAAKRVITRWPR